MNSPHIWKEKRKLVVGVFVVVVFVVVVVVVVKQMNPLN
jgi:hypothetical protein